MGIVLGRSVWLSLAQSGSVWLSLARSGSVWLVPARADSFFCILSCNNLEGEYKGEQADAVLQALLSRLPPVVVLPRDPS